jgi:predicted dehydrogenase
LPNHLHAEYSRKAADRGKHILCEKPLTPTAPEAQSLVEYCSQKKVRIIDGFMWPHHPRTAVMRKLLDSGKIGKVTRVTAAFTFVLDNLDQSNIRLHNSMGGGSLLDVGCYTVYGIRWAMGQEPVKAFARAKYKYDCDVEMTAQLLFPDGSLASMDCGFTLPMRQWVEITGTQGTMTIRDLWVPDDEAKFDIHAGERTETHSVRGHDQIACMLDDFGTALIQNQDPTPHISEAIKSLKVLDALAKSAREGREVDIV